MLAFHIVVVSIILFGWAAKPLWPLYVTTLAITAISYALFGYCILSKWEFNLRKQIDPTKDYDATWLSYYAPGPLKQIPDTFWYWASTTFVVASLSFNLLSLIK